MVGREITEWATWQVGTFIEDDIDTQRAAYRGSEALREYLESLWGMDDDTTAERIANQLLNAADWDALARSYRSDYDPVEDGAICSVCNDPFDDVDYTGYPHAHRTCVES